jgi:very-short-patch-repair endonuclease
MPVDPAVDREVSRLASAQHGQISTAQLLAAGLTRHAVAARVRRGFLRPVHHGVYSVGDPSLIPFAAESAAVLALGPDAVLSHRAAAALWGIAPAAVDGVVDVTLIDRKARPRPAIRLHRVTHLDRADFRRHADLPVTAPARTLIDFAAGASHAQLTRALAEARVLRLVGDRSLAAAIGRAGSRRGTGAVRALLRAQAGPTLTRSDAERLFLALIDDAELPRPACNARIEGYEVDFLWRAQRLVVEVDGRAFHAYSEAFERDRRRDQVLAAAGFAVIRVTWRQLVEAGLAVVARVAQALIARSQR